MASPFTSTVKGFSIFWWSVVQDGIDIKDAWLTVLVFKAVAYRSRAPRNRKEKHLCSGFRSELIDIFISLADLNTVDNLARHFS